jgi:hypothetical protein
MNSSVMLRFRHLTRTRLIVLAAIVFAAMTIITMNVCRRWSVDLKNKAAGTGQITAQGNSDNGAFPIVLLNLTRFGFEPAEMKIPAGKCKLAIRNMISPGDIDLQMARKNGEQVLVEKYSSGRRHWEKHLVLSAGDYVISVVGNPQWAFNLAVTPPGK